MTTETYNSLQSEDFPMIVKCTNSLYENINFIAESKGDFSPYGYAYIQIVNKNNRLKIFKKHINEK